MVERAGHRSVLIRHGQTEWSLTGRHTGRTDLPLTQAGEAEATAIAVTIADFAFALVLTSPLVRSRQTCALAGLDAAAAVDPDLMEWDYGAFEGMTSTEIAAIQPGWSLWRDGCPAGEQPADVAARADRVVARCQAAEGDVAVFAHGHILRVLAARWIGLGPDGGRSLVLATASVSVLGWERTTPAIEMWNTTAPRSADRQ